MPCAEWIMALTSALYLLHTVKQNGGLSLMLLHNSRSLGLCLQQVAALSLENKNKHKNSTFCSADAVGVLARSLLLCICRSENQARVVRKKDNAIQRIKHYPADSVVCFVDTYPLENQGSYTFFKTNFQDSDCLFMDSKIHISPFTPKTSMLILLSVCHFIPSLFPIFCFSFKCI